MTKILVLLMLAWSTFAVASLDAPPYQAFKRTMMLCSRSLLAPCVCSLLHRHQKVVPRCLSAILYQAQDMNSDLSS